MSDAINLDAYFDRIRWGGDTSPTFDTLAGILKAHMLAIPFENLDVLLGRGIRLDLASVQAKLVDARRGGYCFEQTTLFAAALEALGFTPVRHTARVTLFVPRAQAPRTHMYLTVPLGYDTYMVDPGFGGLAPMFPVPVVDAGADAGGTETHWLTRDGRFWLMRARKPDKVIDAWASAMEEENLVDFEMGNHYTSTHPSSPFVNHIMLQARKPDGYVSIMNRDVNLLRAGVAIPSLLADRAALRTLLAADFGIDLPEVETMRVASIPEWD